MSSFRFEISQTIARNKEIAFNANSQTIPDVAWEAHLLCDRCLAVGILSKAVKGWGSTARRLFRIFRVLRHSSRARTTTPLDGEHYRRRSRRRFTVTDKTRDVNRGVGDWSDRRFENRVRARRERKIIGAVSALEGRARNYAIARWVPMGADKHLFYP